MNKIINIIISAFIFAFFTSVSFSVDMPKVPGIGKKSGGGDIDVDALADQQSALVKNMSSALSNIMKSQVKFAEALGKKDLADGLQKDIDNMNAGEATPKKDLKSAVKISTDTQVALNKEMEQATLDAEINGFNDWYLPSLAELEEVYQSIGNSVGGNVGGFSQTPYWSSNMVTSATGVDDLSGSKKSYYVDFSNGTTGYSDKTAGHKVRPIRSF